MKRSPFRRSKPKPHPKAPKPLVPKETGRRIDGGKGPWRSPDYRAYVPATFPCLTCSRPAEHAHHIRECFPRTMGVRISDVYVVPLCERCHTALHARSAAFWTDRHIQPDRLPTWCESVHTAWSKT